MVKAFMWNFQEGKFFSINTQERSILVKIRLFNVTFTIQTYKSEITFEIFFLQPEIEVYRRDSKSLPALEDKTIDWEETVYMNIISHQVKKRSLYINMRCSFIYRTFYFFIYIDQSVVLKGQQDK